MNDTIAAISTALGVGAISIIRVSGNDSINIVNKIFKGKNLNNVASNTINYGYIINDSEIIDEVLVSVFKEPKTFTRENIVEINSHGGIATTNKILELLLLNGCRLAEPGEFTKRAFLNGRIDLIEAEGIIDLINAKTEKSRSLAIKQVDGNVSSLIVKLRESISDILANIEVNIDYPEYEDIEIFTIDMMKEKIKEIECEINNIIRKSSSGKLIKEGIKTIIIGRPNVGKSSILNRLIDEDKAIVTDIAGTTRDIVEGNISLDGILLNIMDTAGIRKTNDMVESIGVKKSLSLIEEADLILFVLNNNDKLTSEDMEILNKIKDKNIIIIINKIDLDNKLELENNINTIRISALNNEGIDLLKERIREIFDLGKIEKEDFTYLSSARSIALMKQSLVAINNVEKGILENMPIDMLEIDLKNAWNLLGEIIGITYEEELIDKLFSKYCLGK